MLELQKVWASSVMNIEWDYSYYQPWSDNKWLVDKMLAMQEEMLRTQDRHYYAVMH